MVGLDQTGSSVRDLAKVKTASRDITKAVLSSPLVIPWPNVPRNYQLAVTKELPRLVPESIADYHTSRARSHLERRKSLRKRARAEEGNKASSSKEGEENGQQDKTEPSEDSPIRPEILDHLVLGINENIKAIETAIDDLKLRLLIMADRLNGSQLKPNSNLLPTAPPNMEGSDSPEPAIPAPAAASPPAFIVIPLHSISPQSLVGGIPQYAATYNSLVWQWGQLSKTVKTRFKEEQWQEVIGEDREELRVVPLGRVEAEMAAMVGLRRLACLAIRRSHPQLSLLDKILPKSILNPPRHALTLPYTLSDLKIHYGDKDKNDSTSVPLPHVHYAPVTVKGITTSTPIDVNSKKKIRLAEVRQKRRDAKLKRKAERDGGSKVKTKSKTSKKGSKQGKTAMKV